MVVELKCIFAFAKYIVIENLWPMGPPYGGIWLTDLCIKYYGFLAFFILIFES